MALIFLFLDLCTAAVFIFCFWNQSVFRQIFFFLHISRHSHNGCYWSFDTFFDFVALHCDNYSTEK